jgi:2'-5' RNA ligase
MQLSLFADAEMRPPLPGPPLERDMIFYALLLGPQLWLPASRLMAAQRDLHGLTGKLRTTDTFHISVLGFGFADEVTADDIAFAAAIGDEVAFAPFELSFTQMLSFDGHRKPTTPCAIVLTPADSSDIIGLGDRLVAAMLARGVRPRSFKPEAPHLTLLYDTVRVPPAPLAAPIPVSVDGFALVYSHRGQGRYTILWRSAPHQPGPTLRPPAPVRRRRWPMEPPVVAELF